MEATRSKQAKLTFLQQRSLDKWLDINWDRLIKEHLTMIQLAAQAQETLKFPINHRNVSFIIKQTGRKFPIVRNRVTRVNVDLVARRFLALLYEKVGETVPVELIQNLQDEELLHTTVTSVQREEKKP
jgi:hypothetical protein